MGCSGYSDRSGDVPTVCVEGDRRNDANLDMWSIMLSFQLFPT